MKLKLTSILLLINLLAADLIREEFEIRHRRSRLIRQRRNGNRNHKYAEKKIKQFITEKTTLLEDNVTITALGEETIVRLPTTDNEVVRSDFDINVTVNSNSYDKTFIYLSGDAFEVSQINQTEADANKTSAESNSVRIPNGDVDIVSHFLRIVESQHLLGDNCTAGTNLTLREGVVDRYAQERFRVEADVAVNKANMLTRLWKYADSEVVDSEYLLYASVFSMVEFDDVIFAAGNCYDQYQYKDYLLFCPYAYRLPEGQILVKDLAVEYNYLSNSSEWFYKARKNAENVIKNFNQFSRGYTSYRYNGTTHDVRIPEEILAVRYEDGKWSKPYYDCGGGNIWMLTYTVPFFGFKNNTYFFKGTSGIDIDLRHVDIDQCPTPEGQTQLNIFADSAKCKKSTTMCVPIAGLGFRRGSYKCICKKGFYFPDTTAYYRYYNGTEIEEEYEKRMLGQTNRYDIKGMFECLACPEGCDSCTDDRPCVVSLNWVMRTSILALSCIIACCLPIILFFTWKWQHIKVVRAASPVLLRVVALGAFFMYGTMIVTYFKPTIYFCTARIWLREIGFALTYGALMLKTWRISVIFRVRSAKAIKITDMNLLKRLGIILAFFTALLTIRTLMAPPIVIVGRTEDDLKAYLCRTDLWDNVFSVVEIAFLIWGIRLCVVVRKAPSEFNESKFISLAIYNEFVLCLFLNVTTFFLQKPANPDLMYIIYFVHTQLSVTLLLGLIFGSKVIMVIKDKGKQQEDSSSMVYKTPSKFLIKGRAETSQYTSGNSSMAGQELIYSKYSEQDIQEEFLRLYTQLELLKERNMRVGNRHLASKINAMQDAARMCDNDNEKTSFIVQSNSSLCISAEKSVTEIQDESYTRIKRQSVSFSAESKPTKDTNLENNTNGTSVQNVDSKNDNEKPEQAKKNDDVDQSCSTTYPTSDKKASTESKSRHLMSGHARTHSIVINLDDKSRFTDEITV
ncbi:metabotropic glycine receptor-like isoform X2 [Rhynchophorus ferrugineus]|uniref:metabotropic glycine receptor-like isoform X2 n=1 Tax=Rhynchophorus ferrugineus TaxID=354439 RepID=UPI003FCCF0C9